MDSTNARGTLKAGGRTYGIYRLQALESLGADLSALPWSLRILLENLLRHEDGVTVRAEDIAALARWTPDAPPRGEIAFRPARVLLQDFTGVPAIVDLAAMRDAMVALGGDPGRVDPLCPVELVIDHSVVVDAFGTADAFRLNEDLDYHRNRERYAFLKWGQQAFRSLTVVPPNTGIVHQVNLEHLARVVFSTDELSQDPPLAYPDTLVGTDSHTPMVNGLGVLGWGVGGIEAEAAMLGQPLTMLVPPVVGFELRGRLREGVTATDLVLTVTERLRLHGVVGKFVEFHGPGLASLRLADRATIGNMSPEYGATCTMFPVDAVTLDYLRSSGRSPERVALVEAYMKEQGLFWTPDTPRPRYSEALVLDLGEVEPSLAGPRRPQDRLRLSASRARFREALPSLLPPGASAAGAARPVTIDGHEHTLDHGAVVIAAITSCTNTSNPSVMVAAGLLAKRACERGLRRQPWVKTSLAPGSKVVTAYLKRANLLSPLEALGFHLVGYGCTTCIGNSGPLLPPVSEAVTEGGLVVASVLSGNRNFEGRIQSEVRANYLCSPPLVVAFALAGRIDLDLESEPLGTGSDGKPVYLRDLWPTTDEIASVVESNLHSEMFRDTYASVLEGDARWWTMPVPAGERFAWDPSSTYVRRPPYFDGMSRAAPRAVADLSGARCLVMLGDSVTTDHISPAGAIKASSPAGQHLRGLGVEPADFNSYGSRRGNHEVMVRGTFANSRLRNRLVPELEGPWTRHLPSGEVMSIYDAATRYQGEGTPLVVLAGKEYGSGSSRDWAAKGPQLQGVRAVIAESYERIHRSNLVGMGLLPLQFLPGEGAAALGLTGEEVFSVRGLAEVIRSGLARSREVTVSARRPDGTELQFTALVRIDTPVEIQYYMHGGVLPYVLRQMLSGKEEALPDGPRADQLPEGADATAEDRHVERDSAQSFPASDPPAH